MKNLPGIYEISGERKYVVGAEVGGIFMVSETLDADDIEDLITNGLVVSDYDLSSDRAQAVPTFREVPYEKWAEIAGTEIEVTPELLKSVDRGRHATEQ